VIVSQPKPNPRSWRRWIYATTVGVLLLVAYATIWKAAFIWDDDLHLTANPCVIGPLGLWEAWTTPEANYFPLVLTHFWVLHKIFGLNPVAYHAINLLLHFANSLLLWGVLSRLKVRGAWLGAALWSLHPVMAETVAWVSEFTNTQSCLFFLISVWAFVCWLTGVERDRVGRWWYAIALISAAGAMLSKPSTVMLPVVFVVCWWWLRVPWRWQRIVGLVPFFVLAAAWSGWTVWEQSVHSGASGAEWNLSLLQRGLLAGGDIWFYLGKLLWPDPLVFVYPRWQIDLSSMTWYLGAIGVLVAATVTYLRRRSSRSTIFAALAFVVLLFPVLGFFNVYYFRFSFVADHFQYLASIAPLAFVGAALSGALRGDGGRGASRLLPFVGVAVVLLSTVLTRQRAAEFVNDETLWRATLAKNPDCWMAHNNLGQLLADKPGGKPQAMAHYREALRLKPDFVDANSNLGNEIANTSGDLATALSYIERAVHDDPNFAMAHINLGNVLAKIPGRSDEAIQEYETALRLRPDSMIAHSNLASELARKPERYDSAVAHYQAALRIEPNNADVHYNLANCFFSRPEHRVDAIKEYEAALRLKPQYAQAEFNLGTAIVATSGDLATAIPHFEAALRLLPDNPAAHYSFATLLSRDPSLADRAIAEYETVVRLAPNDIAAHNDVAVMYAKIGKLQQALGHLEVAVQLDPTNAAARNNLEAVRAGLKK
jgi:protein O-mannosyl-transferase